MFWLLCTVSQFSSVAQSCRSLCDPMDCSTPGLPVHHQLITNMSLLKLMSMESVMPSNHLFLCRPLLLPPSIFPSIKVFSNESVLCTVPETIYSAVEFKKTSDFFPPLWNSKTLLTFFPLYLLNLHFRDVLIIWQWHYFLYVWKFSQSPKRMTGGGLVAK